MDKRVILAAGLSILILIAWNAIFPPPQRPQPVETPVAERIADTDREPPADAERRETAGPDETLQATTPAEAVQAAAASETAFDSELYSVVFSNVGARALSWKLRLYTTTDKQPLELIPRLTQGESRYLTLDLDDPGLSRELNQARWVLNRSRVSAKGDLPAGEKFEFRWADGRGIVARKTFIFREGSYLIDVDVEVTDRGRPVNARLALGPGFAAQELGKKTTYNYQSEAVWIRKGDTERTKAKKLTGSPSRFTDRMTWAGFNDQYFAALVITDGAETEVAWRGETVVPAAIEGEDDAPSEIEEPILSVSLPDGGALLFVGPKKYDLVKALGHDLEEAIYFSRMGWLRPIVKTLFVGLLWIADHTMHNYGVAIILATFLLRLLLFPVNQFAMVSMKRTQLQMQKLQPKVKAIKNKYKKQKDAESRTRMNQDMMDLYKKEGVNPMGGLNGCLPLFAQFPILIGFYNMLTVAIELRGAPFILWITDLSMEDPWKITPLLMGVTMFAQQKLSMSKIKDPQQLQQQRIMLFMPVMFTVICLGLPSGMVLYWFVNNLLGIGQQWLVNRHTERLEAVAQKA